MNLFLKFLGAIVVGGLIVIVLLLGSCALLVGKVAIDVQKNNEQAQHYTPKMTILPGWKWEKDGTYTYVRGRVRNDGDQSVRYWKVTASYLGKKGEVLDSAFTNSAEELKPGAAHSFEIMHRHAPEERRVEIEVSEVRLAPR